MIAQRVFRFAAIAVILAALVVSAVVQPAQGLSLQTVASQSPWIVKTFTTNISTINISTIFGGPDQVPLISYETLGYINFRYQHPDLLGNCGPNNTYVCVSYSFPDMNLYSLSAIAEHTYFDKNTFKVGWVFEDPVSKEVKFHFREWGEGMIYITRDTFPVYYLGDSATVYGQPSLAFDQNGNPHIAVVITSKYTGAKTLIYIHKSTVIQTSCGFLSLYQCDTIVSPEPAYTLGSQPGIAVTPRGNPRIMYYTGVTTSLNYAYPDSYHPNCGPGGNTWRCVPISGLAQSTSDMDLAISPNATNPQLTWTYIEDGTKTTVRHARYVGGYSAGGNCGQDYNPTTQVLDYLWKCVNVDIIGIDAVYKNVSIQVDEAETAMIAYNAANGYTYDLKLFYFYTDGNYKFIKVDGQGINTGRDAALALNKDGLGYIAYIEDMEWSPNLKIAYQDYTRVYIPLITR